MDSDSYKIIITLSHHRISFEYWQRDGGNRLVPMPKGKWPAPLAFYCSDSSIVIGEGAVRAAHTGISNTFENYFEKLGEEKYYTIAGQRRPIRNLLLDAAEDIFRDFFSSVLFNRLGSLTENRASMPLTIVCESDIKPNEKAFLLGLFKDSGYNRVIVVDYSKYINRYIHETLSHECDFDHVLVIWTEDTDLTFTLLDKTSTNSPQTKILKGLGIDPRKQYVENLIWDCVIGRNIWLQRENEEDAISKAAQDFINSSLPLLNGTILLSDGHEYYYSLNRKSLDYIPCNGGVSMSEELDAFLCNHGITNRSRVVLFMRGLTAGNEYFEQNLNHGFSHMIKSGQKRRDDIMRLIIEEENSTGPVIVDPTPTPPPDNGSINPVPDPPIDPNPIDIKSYERKWRQIKAIAKGKIRQNNYKEALSLLEGFLSDIQERKEMDEMIASVNEMIKNIKEEYGQSICNPVHEHDEKVTVHEPKGKEDGKDLLRQGKLKDAREWYRENNDSKMSRLLTEIIRSQKGVEVRKRSIEEYKKKGDKAQIARIVKELEEHIQLCNEADLDCTEYKHILEEYKNIK